MNPIGYYYGTKRREKSGQLLKGHIWVQTSLKAGHIMNGEEKEKYSNLFMVKCAVYSRELYVQEL